LFFRILSYDGGWHTFSDSSGVFHADYVSGWDEDFLQNVLDKCENEGGGAMPNFFCEDFLTFRDAPKCTDENQCDFSDPNLLEKIKAFQPSQPLDVSGTIAAEETEVVVGDLPRGTCQGSFVGNDESGCRDDPVYRFKGKPKKDCEWIKKKSPEKCEKKSVSKSCPVSCDACCKDDSNFSYKGDNTKDCKWVKKKVKNGSSVCKKKSNGTKVKISCPVACGNC
jgi:hypothetical protein